MLHQTMKGARFARPVILLFLLAGTTLGHARGLYQTPQAFLEEAFGSQRPDVQRIWLSGELADIYRDVMQEAPPQLRLRYWQRGRRSAWILQTIGKEQPITACFVVEDERLLYTQVLEFRENRGWEIRYPFFTGQFHHLGLDARQELDKGIDGITGATLSVRAMTNMARLALMLTQKVISSHDTP